MDISPNALCIIKPKYIYYIPPKKHPDRLIEDWLYNKGEFSVWADIYFERNLQRILNYKKNGYNSIPVPALA